MTAESVDWADLYALRPRLWSELVAEVDWKNSASVMRFAERAHEIVACLTDVHHRLPGLGLTLAQLVELRQRAWEAEDAASASWTGELHLYRALAPAMRGAIVNLSVRGLESDRIACALEVHPAWVDDALAGLELADRDRAVLRSHLAGRSLPEIIRETLTPETTVVRVIHRFLGEEPRTNRRADAAERKLKAWRWHQQGVPVAEIAERLGVPKETAKKLVQRGKPRAAE